MNQYRLTRSENVWQFSFTRWWSGIWPVMVRYWPVMVRYSAEWTETARFSMASQDPGNQFCAGVGTNGSFQSCWLIATCIVHCPAASAVQFFWRVWGENPGSFQSCWLIATCIVHCPAASAVQLGSWGENPAQPAHKYCTRKQAHTKTGINVVVLFFLSFKQIQKTMWSPQ